MKMANKQFVNSDEEFQPLLRQIYESNLKSVEDGEDHLPINVEPKKIICLRLQSGGGKKLAYIKPIRGEFRLLTEARYFLVICNDQFNGITSNEHKKWIILHEYLHTLWNEEKQDYETRDHNIKDFAEIVKNPEPNLDLVKKYKYEQGKMFEDDKV
jgi:predicted SprT family Zn-dependent metalloprotease